MQHFCTSCTYLTIKLTLTYVFTLAHLHITFIFSRLYLFICFISSSKGRSSSSTMPPAVELRPHHSPFRENSCHNTITSSLETPHLTCQSAHAGKPSSALLHRADSSGKLCVLHETCSNFQQSGLIQPDCLFREQRSSLFPSIVASWLVKWCCHSDAAP